MRVGFLSAIPAPVTDYATVRRKLLFRKQLSQTMMPVFCCEGVLHTVADILCQTRLRISMVCLEGFTMRRSYYVVLVATSVGVAWTMPYRNRGLREANTDLNFHLKSLLQVR